MSITRLAKILFLFITLFLLSFKESNGQINRIGVGLTFSTPVDFNYGETGNPGLLLSTWVTLNKASTFHFVPSLTAYYRYKMETGYSILTNYMFQGDLNFQYRLFHEGNVKAVVLGGANLSYLDSDFEPVILSGNETITDTTDFGLGANLGAALELRMAPRWDFNISGKYVFSKYSQFVISVQGAYYFKTRRRAYRR